jgi:hypothetical protein
MRQALLAGPAIPVRGADDLSPGNTAIWRGSSRLTVIEFGYPRTLGLEGNCKDVGMVMKLRSSAARGLGKHPSISQLRAQSLTVTRRIRIST